MHGMGETDESAGEGGGGGEFGAFLHGCLSFCMSTWGG